MDSSLSVKLLVLLMGVSTLGVLGSSFYKLMIYRQFKRLEKESSQVFSAIKHKMTKLLSGGVKEENLQEKEQLKKAPTVSKDDMKKIHALLDGIDEKIANGDYKDAERHLVEALGVDPNNEDVNSLLAFVFLKQGRFNKAESIYTHMIEQGTEDAGVYANLGRVLEEQGELETASYAYKEAIMKEPKEPKRYMQLAETYVRMDRHDQAIPLYEEVVRLTNSNDVRMVLAGIFEFMKEKDRQVIILKEILELDPKYEDAKRKLAELRS